MTPYYADDAVTLYLGDALDVLRSLPDASVDCCVTSPPYFGLRDYGVAGQYGLETSPAEYVETMRAVFAEVRRVLADDGTFWLNLGDSYVSAAGGAPQSGNIATNGGQRYRRPRAQDYLPPKNLLGMPWRTAFALQDDGWILRNDIIWHKLTAMPESVTDRLSARHEHVFLFSKSRRYWFDLDPIRERIIHLDTSHADTKSAVGGKYDPASRFRPATGSRHNGRPQLARALALAEQHGLTEAHLSAIRAVGMSDTGKAAITQSGAGKNRTDVQALADEAKAALGGYYREFLTPTGKNPGDVWSLPAQPFPEAHFATMPRTLAERCVLAGCKPGGTVLDPFSGSGTTGYAANKHGRKYVGIDLSADYLDLSLRTRFAQPGLDLTGGVA